MKTPSDYPLVKFRPGQPVLGPKGNLMRSLATRSTEQNDRAYSETAKQDLSHYYELLTLCLPTFSDDEWLLLTNVVSAWIATPQTVHLLWAEVQGYLDLYVWEIDHQDLIARLRALSRFECWSIVNAIHFHEVQK